MNMPTPQPKGYVVLYIKIPEVVVPGMRLGRHVRRDSRSLAYRYTARRDPRDLADQLWTRHIPILDQGDVGSCTGDEETGVLGTSPFWDALPASVQGKLNQQFAYNIYSQAETIDGDGPYPPNDYGSSGSSAAQAALNDGCISGYVEVDTVAAMADALQEGPVGVGVNWYSSFDTPGPGGLISISSGAYVRGGHEFEIRGVKISEQLFLADNSWGTDWGNAGSFELSWDTMARLLSEQGDCTKCVPLSAPAPTPTPVPPDADHLFWYGGDGEEVPGGLQEWCRTNRTRPDLAELKHDALLWARAKGFPS